jgi:hypothetical protein
MLKQLAYQLDHRWISIETQLKFLDYLCSFVPATYFVGVSVRFLYPAAQSGLTLTTSTILPAILAFVFAVVFFLSRHSVKVELRIGRKLFPVGRIPEKWSDGTGAIANAAAVFIWVLLYGIGAWSADHIMVVSMCMLIITLIDYRTEAMKTKMIPEYLASELYQPKIEEADYDVILETRDVARQYLERPRLRKEAARMAGCGVAFGLSAGGCVLRAEWLKLGAYFSLIATLLANEGIAVWWRCVRDGRLREIEERLSGA